jgi:lysophospholipase L1-like esterase
LSASRDQAANRTELRGAAAPLRLPWTKVIVFSLLPVFLLLAAGEIGLRVWVYWFRTPYERYNASTGRLELVRNLHSTNAHGLEFRINSKGFVGPEFDAVKPAGLYRIFAVGDSCTFGSGFWRLAYPGVLGQLLTTSEGDGRFEVINAGIEGYNSEFALDRIRTELLAYHPDMVLLYIGWNDLMKIDPRNEAETGRHTTLARILERSYLMKALSKVLFADLRPLISKPRVGPDPVATGELAEFVPARYRANLEAIVELLKANGVVPVLLTLATVVTPDMTLDDIKREHVFFPYYPTGYGVAGFLQLHRAYNKVIRMTAAKYRVPIVDLEPVFDGPARGQLFWDTIHPSEKGHQLIADALLPVVRANSTHTSSPRGNSS